MIATIILDVEEAITRTIVVVGDCAAIDPEVASCSKSRGKVIDSELREEAQCYLYG